MLVMPKSKKLPDFLRIFNFDTKIFEKFGEIWVVDAGYL